MAEIKLTEEQFNKVIKDYFAQENERQRMTKEEIEILAQKLNEDIGIPFVSERNEFNALAKIILEVDNFLYNNLPNELYDLIRSTADGVNNEEAKTLIRRLSRLANKHLDIPYLPEEFEYLAIRFILGLVVNALRKDWNLDIAADNSKAVKEVVPRVENPEDAQLESMILVTETAK
jgi:hypothetical protein